MSYESAFYNKYAHLTKHSHRELLQTLLALHNLANQIKAISRNLANNAVPASDPELYSLVCSIQEEFLTKRELLCVANECICEDVRISSQIAAAAYTNSKSIDPALLQRIKNRKHYYEQISAEHKNILNKQDDRLTSAIQLINQVKNSLDKPQPS